MMKLLSTPQVAERLGVTVSRVQALIWAGRLPAQKVGRDYVILEDDLQLVKDRKPGRPSEAWPQKQIKNTRIKRIKRKEATDRKGRQRAAIVRGVKRTHARTTD